MAHVVLLGDSIFDNSAYVPDGHAVIEHLRAILPEDWSVSLLAVDGHVTSDVKTQLEKVPNDATHFVVSCGWERRVKLLTNTNGADAVCCRGP